MEERRKLARKYLSYFSRVIDPNTERLLGYLVDLTTGGALMIGNIPLQQDEVLTMRIDLPEELSPQEQLNLTARVVWVVPDIDPELYRTGLQMVEIESSDLDLLEQLLSNFASQK